MEEWSCGTGKKLLIKLFEQSVTRRVRRTTGRNLKEAMRWHIHVEGRSVAKCYAASILEIQHLYGRKFNKQTGRCLPIRRHRHQVPFSGPMESHSSDSHYMSTTCHYSIYQQYVPQSSTVNRSSVVESSCVSIVGLHGWDMPQAPAGKKQCCSHAHFQQKEFVGNKLETSLETYPDSVAVHLTAMRSQT